MKTSLSPFGRKKGSKNNGSFTNGPNSKERSVWIGGTTAFVRQARAREEDGETPLLREQHQHAKEEDNFSSTNPSDSSRGLFSVSTGENDAREKQQRQKKPSILKRIKALSPRRGDNSGGKDDADDDDGDDIFFSPASNPPSGEGEDVAAAVSPTNRKMKRQLSVSIGGETILGEEENTLSSSSLSSSKNNRRTPRRGNDKTMRRNRRNSSGSSSSSSYHSRQLFGSVTSVDIPSRALTLSSLDDTDENLDGKSSSRQEEDVDLEAATVNNPSRQMPTPPQRVGSKRKNNVNYRRVSTAEAVHNSLRHEEASNSATRVKRRRLSKRARTRLTMREVNTHIQPGRHNSAFDSMGSLEKTKAITIPKAIDFFLRIEVKLIALNTLVSVLLTLLVVHVFPDAWKTGLEESSLAVSLLGAFLSFALVFRTQTCYNRWWEARTQWGRMNSVCVNLAGQAQDWFADVELIDRFLTHCIIFPYACKAALRGNALNGSSEEGPRFLQTGLLTDADLGVIIRHGRAPFTCLEIMRRALHEALLLQSSHSTDNTFNRRLLPSETLVGAYLAMEESFAELYLNFGACSKINSTRMPASYTVFMRTFIIFFFVLASLSWAPTIKWLTPILIGFMVFLINTVIVIGDQMMRPFTLSWSGLPMQKFCVIIEQEILAVSRRKGDIDRLFRE